MDRVTTLIVRCGTQRGTLLRLVTSVVLGAQYKDNQRLRGAIPSLAIAFAVPRYREKLATLFNGRLVWTYPINDCATNRVIVQISSACRESAAYSAAE